ncbi:hypothetical protein BDF20DRAFT_897915 [Mycotypha africana]|uniref:uncharacterized protein n=1 Tax=Mycotypha africana TaxID=64632 RepID=UPI0023019249|nr:uncharacterized protein BDF20DRAFT_897915 [Mycotypha africana]KAI8967931.1 hypothetical protein BDF20DRAFT_897915 [Mycotypha africana]
MSTVERVEDTIAQTEAVILGVALETANEVVAAAAESTLKAVRTARDERFQLRLDFTDNENITATTIKRAAIRSYLDFRTCPVKRSNIILGFNGILNLCEDNSQKELFLPAEWQRITEKHGPVFKLNHPLLTSKVIAKIDDVEKLAKSNFDGAKKKVQKISSTTHKMWYFHTSYNI